MSVSDDDNGGSTRKSHTYLVIFSVLVEELFTEGLFGGGGRFVDFAKGAEVGGVDAGGEVEGRAGVVADAVCAAHGCRALDRVSVTDHGYAL